MGSAFAYKKSAISVPFANVVVLQSTAGRTALPDNKKSMPHETVKARTEGQRSNVIEAARRFSGQREQARRRHGLYGHTYGRSANLMGRPDMFMAFAASITPALTLPALLVSGREWYLYWEAERGKSLSVHEGTGYVSGLDTNPRSREYKLACSLHQVFGFNSMPPAANDDEISLSEEEVEQLLRPDLDFSGYRILCAQKEHLDRLSGALTARHQGQVALNADTFEAMQSRDLPMDGNTLRAPQV